LGFAVKKGEKATYKFPIWKYSTKKVEKENKRTGEKGEKETGRCFMKMSAFFTEHQVEPIKAGAK